MRELTALEEKIYNDGERLIFGITHNLDEDIRHRSSYLFFRDIIKCDQLTFFPDNGIDIVDMGCGVGHGCQVLAEIGNSKVVGLDTSLDALDYARTWYSSTAIDYHLADIPSYIAAMREFDYVVSRGVFEHIPDGLNLALNTRWKQRLIFDVPYDEPDGNPHHLILGIREEVFAAYQDVELFYQDLAGNIYDQKTKPDNPNMIICVRSKSGLPRISDIFTFPRQKWQPTHDPRLFESTQRQQSPDKNCLWLEKDDLFPIAISKLRQVDTLLDIGCGIRPQTYIPTRIHICCEPFLQYIKVLQAKTLEESDPQKLPYVLIQATWAEAVKLFPEKSVDSVFLIDVIEHLTKEESLYLLLATEKIARKQVVVFTTLGFMQQHDDNGKDAWGLDGVVWQEHRSGWQPEDFADGWDVYVCKDFHSVNNLGETLAEPSGAIWAIKNIDQAASNLIQDHGAENKSIIEHLKETARQNPTDIAALKQLAKAYGALDQNEQALQLYSQVLQLRPDDIEAYLALGDMCRMEEQHHIDSGGFSKTRYFLNKALELEPNNSYALLRLAQIDRLQA